MKRNLIKIIFTISYCALIIFVFRKEVKFFMAPDPEIKKTIREEFDYGKSLDFASIKTDGFIGGEKGLYLKEGAMGRLTYLFRKDADEVLTVYIRSYAEGAIGGVAGNWKIYLDGGELKNINKNIRRFDKRDFLINLIADSIGKREVALEFEATNKNSIEIPALNWLEIKFINPGTIKGSTYEYPTSLSVLLFLFLLVTPVLTIYHTTRRFIVIWLILLLGFYLRYQNLTKTVFIGLETDPAKYMQYAKEMRLFTADGFYSGKFDYRTPIAPLVSKIFHFALGGYTPTHQRMVSFFFSVLLIVITYVLGKKLLRENLALFLAGLISINPVLVYESTRGNPLEFLTCLLTGFLITAYFLKIRLRNVVILGIVAGIIALSSFYFILPTLIFTFFLFIDSRGEVFATSPFKKPFLSWLIIIIFILAIFLPYYYRVSKVYGDITRKYAWLNAELEYSGKQRAPFDKEIRIKYPPGIQRDFSYFEYLFRMHSFKDILFYHFLGYAKALIFQGAPLDRNNYLGFISAQGFLGKLRYIKMIIPFGLINIICIIGLFRCLLRKKLRLLSIFVFLYLFPITFILGWRVFEFQRYVMHVYPVSLACGALLFGNRHHFR